MCHVQNCALFVSFSILGAPSFITYTHPSSSPSVHTTSHLNAPSDTKIINMPIKCTRLQVRRMSFVVLPLFFYSAVSIPQIIIGRDTECCLTMVATNLYYCHHHRSDVSKMTRHKKDIQSLFHMFCAGNVQESNKMIHSAAILDFRQH